MLALLAGALAPAAALGAPSVGKTGAGGATILYDGTALRDQPIVDFANNEFTFKERNGLEINDGDGSGGCTESGNTVKCPASGVDLIKIDVKASDDSVAVGTSVTKPTLILGGNGEDHLVGGSGRDTIIDHDTDRLGGGHAQVLVGGAGDDSLDASGAGRNAMDGPVPDAQNELHGGAGNDTLVGGPGADLLLGGDQNDTLDGREGPDDLVGEEGSDTASYKIRSVRVFVSVNDPASGDGTDDDLSKDGSRRDLVIGSTENVTGGSGDDILEGLNTDNLDNVLKGGPGADILNGISGNDTLEGDAGPDTLIGGVGTDTASYADHSAPVTASIEPSSNLGSAAKDDGNSSDGAVNGRDAVTSTVENIRGGPASDTLIGNDVANTLQGGFGNDTLLGGLGNDQLEGEGDDDTLDGNEGRDVYAGGRGIDTADYSTRTKRIVADIDGVQDDGEDPDGDGAANEGDNVKTDMEAIVGGPLDDNLTGDSGPNGLFGNAGNDNLGGGDGDDTLDGGVGDDLLRGQAGVDTISYAGRSQPLVVDLDGVPDDGVDLNGDGVADERDNAGANAENLIGGLANDTLIGNDSANKIVGGQGADILRGGPGDDRMQSAEDPITGLFGQPIAQPILDNEVACGADFDTAVRDLLDAAANLGSNCEAFEDAPVGEHPTARISNRARYRPRRRALVLRVVCPRKHKQRVCRGTLRARLGAKGGRSLAARRYRVRRKHSKTVSLRLSRREARALRRVRRVRVIALGHDRRGRIKRTSKPYRLRRGQKVKGPSILVQRRARRQ